MKFDKSFTELAQPPVGHGHLRLKPHALHLIHRLQRMKTVLKEVQGERDNDHGAKAKECILSYPSEEASCLDRLVDLVYSEEILYTLAVDISVCRVECPGLLHPLSCFLQITSMLQETDKNHYDYDYYCTIREGGKGEEEEKRRHNKNCN